MYLCGLLRMLCEDPVSIPQVLSEAPWSPEGRQGQRGQASLDMAPWK